MAEVEEQKQQDNQQGDSQAQSQHQQQDSQSNQHQDHPEIPRPLPEAESVYRRWLTHLNSEFTRHTSYDRRSEIVRDELHMLILGRPHGGKNQSTLV